MDDMVFDVSVMGRLSNDIVAEQLMHKCDSV